MLFSPFFFYFLIFLFLATLLTLPSSYGYVLSTGISEDFHSLSMLCSELLSCGTRMITVTSFMCIAGCCSASFHTQAFQLLLCGLFPKSEYNLASFVRSVKSLITFVCVCVCVCGLPGYVASNATGSLLSKMFRIKKLYNYTKVEASVATSVCWILELSQAKSNFWLELQERPPSHSQPSPAASTTLQSYRSCLPKESTCCFPCFILQNMLASFQFEYSNTFCPAEMQLFTLDQ